MIQSTCSIEVDVLISNRLPVAWSEADGADALREPDWVSLAQRG